MYQTVGHALIPLYATALNLPLYRQEILGSALNSQKDYYPPFLSESPPSNLRSPTGVDVDNLEDQEVEELIEQLQQVWSNDSLMAREKLSHLTKIWQSHPNQAPVSGVSTSHSATTTTNYDETESLVPLLRHVVASHPSANAICSGAILSTYQRTRIESVAQRLHLVPLSYLWQYPSLPTPIPRRAGLLEDMRAVGLDARIVKVASGGLDEGLLWGNVLDPEVKGRVEKAVGRFGGSVLGEGGEFETLALDGPAGVWKGSIQVREDERWVGTGQGGEAWVGLREGAGMVVVKKGQGDGWKERLRGVNMWDKQFTDLLASMPDEGTAAKGTESKEINPHGSIDQAKTLTQQTHDWHIECSQTISNSTLKISNMAAAHAGNSAEHQMVMINAELRKILRNHERHPSDIVFTTLLLRSLADFSIINSIYANLFAKPNPPTRVTAVCGDSMPKGVEILASFVVDLGPCQVRDGLHVQSRSYWAPANIGPYSQAIAVPFELEKESSLVYVAGQIPLVPASMEVLREENDVEQSAGDDLPLLQKQTCLSLQHLWRIGKAMRVRWWTGAIAFITGDTDVRRKAILAWLTWMEIHDVNERREDQEVSEDGLDAWDKKYGGLGSHAVEEEKHRLPDFQTVNWDHGQDPQHIHVPGFFAIQVAELPRGCSIEWQSLGLVSLDYLSQASLDLSTKDGSPIHTCNIGRKRISMISIPLTTLDFRIALEKVVDPSEVRKETEYAFHATIYTRKAWLVADLKAQVVPCEGVWGAEGKELAAAVVVVYEEFDHLLTRTSP